MLKPELLYGVISEYTTQPTAAQASKQDTTKATSIATRAAVPGPRLPSVSDASPIPCAFERADSHQVRQ